MAETGRRADPSEARETPRYSIFLARNILPLIIVTNYF
jgi:hypothetical protein